MAIPDEEVRRLLNALSESSLTALAVQARIAIEELSETDPQGPTERIEAGRIQVEALRESVLFPLKREMEATQELPELARRFGLKPNVFVLADEKVGDAPRLVSLTDRERLKRLNRFLAVLAQELDEAEQAILRREGHQH
jgi:hypothetical protein